MVSFKEMVRDFDKWTLLKKKLDKKDELIWFKEKEVWWCAFGANIGDEEDGKNELYERPVLIFRKYNRRFFWGLPLTSKLIDKRYYQKITLHDKNRSVILSQSRALSSKRLLRRIGKISSDQFSLVEDGIIKIIKTEPLRVPRVPKGNL